MAKRIPMDDWPTQIVDQLSRQGWKVDCVYRCEEFDDEAGVDMYFFHGQCPDHGCGGDFVGVNENMMFVQPFPNVVYELMWDAFSSAVHHGVNEITIDFGEAG